MKKTLITLCLFFMMVTVAQAISINFAVDYDRTDVDEDSIPAYLDNCPDSPNPLQANVDGDAIGDVCDEDTIYGYVSGEFKEGLAISVSLCSDSVCTGKAFAAEPTTDDNGYYAAGNLSDGHFIVEPQSDLYVFYPTNAIVVIPNE